MFAQRFVGAILTTAVLIAIPATAVVAVNGGEPDPWTQVGQALGGSTASENWGSAVALNDQGTIMAIGGPGADLGGGLNQGRVGVYRLSADSWNLMGAILPGENPGSEQGRSVALSADGLIVAIGAPGRAGGSPVVGKVWVYQFVEGSWVQRGAPIEEVLSGEQAGAAIALSPDGSRLVVGAKRFNTGTGTPGQIRIYDWDGTQWSSPVYVLSGTGDDQLGSAVSISGDGLTVAAGAPGHNENQGHVQLVSVLSGSWQAKGSVILGGGSAEAAGSAVALDTLGNTVAIGAPFSAAGGSVRVFDFLEGEWSQRGETQTGLVSGERFGTSVSLSGDGTRFVAGAPRNSDTGLRAGHARSLHYTDSAWVALGGAFTGLSPGDQAGSSVALAASGNTVALGAPFHDQPLTDAGQVRVWAYPESSPEEQPQGEAAGAPGIHMLVVGEVGQTVEGAPFYFGAYLVQPSSRLVVSVREMPGSTVKVLFSGDVTAEGHFATRMTLPALTPGSYTITLLGTHLDGSGLKLVASFRVGTDGQFVTLGSNLPGIW